MVSLLLTLSAVLSLLSLCYGEVFVEGVFGHSHRYTRVTLRNSGDQRVALADYGLAIYSQDNEARSRFLDPISAAVIQPSAAYSICHPAHPLPCDVYWSGAELIDGDIVELLKSGIPVHSIRAGEEATAKDGGRSRADVSASTRTGLPEVTPMKASLGLTGRSVEGLRYHTDLVEINQDIFDDSCWSIRSQLSTFPLDSCSKPISKATVTVGTFNTLFLFDGIRDRISIWRTVAEADAHLQKIADVVRLHRPDILVLEEVENLDMVKRLVTAVETPIYVPSFVQGRDTYTGQDVALITQGDWVRNVTRTNCRSSQVAGSSCGASLSRTIGVSKNIVALFDSCLFGFKFAIVGLHFYARPTDKRPCIRRESQARVIQDVVKSLIDAGFEVMVMGDVNDYSDKYDDVLTAYSPTSRVMSMLRDPDGDGVDELDNVMRLLPESKRYTAWWDRDEDGKYSGIEEASHIDHILMTKRLFGLIQSVWIDHDMNPEAVSDHWPLFVKMTTRPVA